VPIYWHRPLIMEMRLCRNKSTGFSNGCIGTTRHGWSGPTCRLKLAIVESIMDLHRESVDVIRG